MEVGVRYDSDSGDLYVALNDGEWQLMGENLLQFGTLVPMVANICDAVFAFV